MNLKKRFLIKPKKMTVLDKLQFIGELQTEAKIKAAFRNNYQYHGELLPSNIDSVVIKKHSLERWNERVGPKLEQVDLDLLFKQLLTIPYRITTLSNEIAIIDDDILFIYKIEGTQLIVLTIYGRISLKPSLQDLEKLKSHNYHTYDRLNLEIPAHILAEQIVPYIPKQVFHFSGSRHYYRIDVFDTLDGERVFLKLFFNGQQRCTLINTEFPKQSLINRKVLYILWRLGYEEFVTAHYCHHYPEKSEEMKLESQQKTWAIEQQQLAEQEKQAELNLLSRIFNSTTS